MQDEQHEGHVIPEGDGGESQGEARDGAERHFRKVKASQPAMEVERASPELLRELSGACEESTHASSNVQAKREDVTREMVIARCEQEVARRVHTDADTGQQHHHPPEWRCQPKVATWIVLSCGD